MTLIEHQLDFGVEVHDRGGWTVVVARGELDAYTAPSLRADLHKVITGGNTRVIVDLTQVPFVDASGLGVLVGALAKVRRAGGELRLVGQRRLSRLLEIAWLHHALPLFPSSDAAVADPDGPTTSAPDGDEPRVDRRVDRRSGR